MNMAAIVSDSSYSSLLRHMKKAIDSREDVFQADREAVDDLLTANPEASEKEQLIAKQQARGAAVVKEAITNNRWYMMQAVMFGVGSIARAAWAIHSELVRIRESLEARPL